MIKECYRRRNETRTRSELGLQRTLLSSCLLLLLLYKSAKLAAEHFATSRNGDVVNDTYASAKLLVRGGALLDVGDKFVRLSGTVGVQLDCEGENCR